MQSSDSDSRPKAMIGDELSMRIRELRGEHPSLRVTTELIRLDEIAAVVRAEIVLPAGGIASGFGSAPGQEPGAVEIAEERALLRALAILGHTQISQSLTPAEALAPNTPEPQSMTVDHAEPEPAPHQGHDSREQEEILPGVPEEIAPETDDDVPLEDYSWTSFWQWARKLGYQNKIAVEEVIGQSITSLNPAQVRNLLRAKTGAE